MRQPPRHIPVRRRDAELAPRITTEEAQDAYLVRLLPPAGGTLQHARVVLADDDQLEFEGHLVVTNDEFAYVTRRRAGVYSEPSVHALVAHCPAGHEFSGSAPTRDEGWIMISRDQWMRDDGSVALLGRQAAPSRPHPFARLRWAPPADALLSDASSTPLRDGSGGLVVSVPRARRRPAAPPPRKVPISHAQQRRAPPPAQVRSAPSKTTVQGKPAPSAAPATAPAHGTGMGADEYRQRHKQRAAERRAGIDSLVAESTSAAGGPVLCEVPEREVSPRNVQSPSEEVEEWEATTDGGFVRGDVLAGENATHAHGCAANAPKRPRAGPFKPVFERETSSSSEEELSYWGF